MRLVTLRERLERGLQAIGGPGAVGGGPALVPICDLHGLDDVAGVFDTC